MISTSWTKQRSDHNAHTSSSSLPICVIEKKKFRAFQDLHAMYIPDGWQNEHESTKPRLVCHKFHKLPYVLCAQKRTIRMTNQDGKKPEHLLDIFFGDSVVSPSSESTSWFFKEEALRMF